MSSVATRLDQLRRRLLAANLRSRSIRLTKTTRSGAFDLARLADLNRSALAKVVQAMGTSARRVVPLVAIKGAVDEKKHVSEDLRRLANAAYRTLMEVGENELLLGWPFLEAKLAGTWIRAPLLLYPAALERSKRGKLTWNLVREGRPDVNEVLTQALYRLAGVQLELDRLFEIDEDSKLQLDQQTWAAIRQWLAEGGLEISVTGPEPGDPEPLTHRLKDDQNAFPDGQTELHNHLILGRFPQSSSNVLNEYNELATRLDLLSEGPAAELLAVDIGGLLGESEPEPSPSESTSAKDTDADAAAVDERSARILPSDASQEAIIRGLDHLTQRGLVVRGPPGTGKSQLIANLVGQALHRNERLLVVCQKRAALDVVAQRLESVGLGEPLALVHDVHRDRQAFCNSLARTLAPVLEPDEGLDTGEIERSEKRVLGRHRKAQRRFAARLEAGGTAYRAMMARGPGGRALADLLERALDDDGRVLPDLAKLVQESDSESLQNITEEQARELSPKLESAARDARRFAAPHPLVWRTDWATVGESDLRGVRANLEALRERLLACTITVDASMTPREAHELRALWSDCDAVLDLFETGDAVAHNQFALFWHFTDAGRENSGFEKLIERLERALDELRNVPPSLFATETMTVIDWIAELEELEELQKKWWRVFLPQFWRVRRRPGRIMDRCDIGPSAVPVDLLGLCRMTLRWHELVREVGELQADYPFFDFGCAGQVDDVERAIDAVRQRHEMVQQVHRLQERLVGIDQAYQKLPAFDPESNEAYGALPFFVTAIADREMARRLQAAVKASTRLARSFRSQWLGDCLRGSEQGAPDARLVDEVLTVWGDAEAVAQLDATQADLPDWGKMFLRFYRPAGEDADADGAQPDDESPFAGFDPQHLEADAVLALERAWRKMSLAGQTSAQAEAALVEDAQRNALSAAYDQVIELAGPTVLANFRRGLRERVAEAEAGRLLRKLLLEVQKKRRRRSIRQLVEAYWAKGLSQVRPVWLCSPDSVAALFPLEPGMFDLIVMDEASQCPVESALPALVRGRRVVVAGDEKQMPPSHFFAARDSDEEEVDDGEEPSALLAAESILDVARIAYPGSMLRFHYRSRHEELITFSNHAFYGGRLVTAPPAKRDLADFEGVHFEQVAGLWQNQTNRIEAELTVDRVLSLLSQKLPNGDRPTVGVVTFNRKQRALIEELLDLRIVTDAEARDILSTEWERDPNKALFVKNIENVQGDERDIIAFSTGYGPSEAGGRVAARFGPVGQEGGEHRLNVAITRAKYGVHIISSFAPVQLDTGKTQNVGPKLLERYLHYVERAEENDLQTVERILADVRTLTNEAAVGQATEMRGVRIGSRVRRELADQLERRGLHVEREFGIGPYRLDLAVRRTDDESHWACGVDCTRFLGTPDTIQRDVTEPAFWRRAGWRIFRVSPALWLERRKQVVKAIVQAVDGS